MRRFGDTASRNVLHRPKGDSMFVNTMARLVGSTAALAMALTGAGAAASAVAQAAPTVSISSVSADSLTAEQRQNAYTMYSCRRTIQLD